jgi:hypothetical protein
MLPLPLLLHQLPLPLGLLLLLLLVPLQRALLVDGLIFPLLLLPLQRTLAIDRLVPPRARGMTGSTSGFSWASTTFRTSASLRSRAPRMCSTPHDFQFANRLGTDHAAIGDRATRSNRSVGSSSMSQKRGLSNRAERVRPNLQEGAQMPPMGGSHHR